MMKKRLIAAAVLLIMLLAAGCGREKEELVDEYVYRYSSVGEIVDKGEIKAVCPKGWTNVDAYDYTVSVDEPADYIVEFVKGGASVADNKPFIRVVRHLTGDAWSVPKKDQFSDVSDVTPITAGTRTWKGFSGSVNGQRFVWLSTTSSDGYALEAQLWTHPEGEVSADINDTDVFKILESVEVTVPEKKGR